MFSKNSHKNGPAAAMKAVPSLLSADLRIIGDLTSEGEIQIDGQVEGDIKAHTVVVGETAGIRGEIVGEIVRIHGSVTGQIRGRSVSLARTARVVGDIQHASLSIEAGAYLEGHCKHVEHPTAGANETAPLTLLPGTREELQTA